MSEIVPHPKAPEAKTKQAAREMKEAEARAEAMAEAARREERQRRLQQARAAMKQRPLLHADSQRRQVARNLWDILDGLEKGPLAISKTRVLVAAGKARPEDSTKHLPRYAMRPGLQEDEETKRTATLVKKASAYVELARKAAELAGTDPDEAEAQVLAGSDYMRAVTPEQANDESWLAADQIAEGLRRIVERLAEKYDLCRYFEVTERQRLALVDNFGEAALVPTALGTLAGITLPFTSRPEQVEALDRLPGIHVGTVVAGERLRGIAGGFCHVHGSYADPDRVMHVVSPVAIVPTWDVDIRIGAFGASQNSVALIVLQPRTRVRLWSPDGRYAVGDAEGPLGVDGIEYDNINIGEHEGFPEKLHLNPRPWGRDRDNLSMMITLATDRLSTAIENLNFIGWDLYVEYRSISITNETGLNAAYDLQKFNSENRLDVELFSERSRHFTPQPWVECLGADAENLRDCLLLQPFRRHFGDAWMLADRWVDERQGGTPANEHPLHEEYEFSFDQQVRASEPEEQDPATPTVAPEGTLLALLERWLRGDVVNRASLEESLEEAVVSAIKRLEAAEQHAKERLSAAAQGLPRPQGGPKRRPPVPIAPPPPPKPASE